MRTLAHSLHRPAPIGPEAGFVLIQWREPSTGDMVYRDEGTYATLAEAEARVVLLRAARPAQEFRVVPVVP